MVAEEGRFAGGERHVEVFVKESVGHDDLQLVVVGDVEFGFEAPRVGPEAGERHRVFAFPVLFLQVAHVHGYAEAFHAPIL